MLVLHREIDWWNCIFGQEVLSDALKSVVGRWFGFVCLLFFMFFYVFFFLFFFFWGGGGGGGGRMNAVLEIIIVAIHSSWMNLSNSSIHTKKSLCSWGGGGLRLRDEVVQVNKSKWTSATDMQRGRLQTNGLSCNGMSVVNNVYNSDVKSSDICLAHKIPVDWAEEQ